MNTCCNISTQLPACLSICEANPRAGKEDTHLWYKVHCSVLPWDPAKLFSAVFLVFCLWTFRTNKRSGSPLSSPHNCRRNTSPRTRTASAVSPSGAMMQTRPPNKRWMRTHARRKNKGADRRSIRLCNVRRALLVFQCVVTSMGNSLILWSCLKWEDHQPQHGTCSLGTTLTVATSV